MVHRCKALAYLLHVEPRVLSGSSRTSKNKTLLRIEQWIPKLPAMTCANPGGKELMLNCFASVTCTWSPWWFSSMAAKTVANSVTGRKESLEGRWGKPPPELALAPDQSSYPQPQYQVAIGLLARRPRRDDYRAVHQSASSVWRRTPFLMALSQRPRCAQSRLLNASRNSAQASSRHWMPTSAARAEKDSPWRTEACLRRQAPNIDHPRKKQWAACSSRLVAKMAEHANSRYAY